MSKQHLAARCVRRCRRLDSGGGPDFGDYLSWFGVVRCDDAVDVRETV
jgi:hypothetical protein